MDKEQQGRAAKDLRSKRTPRDKKTGRRKKRQDEWLEVRQEAGNPTWGRPSAKLRRHRSAKKDSSNEPNCTTKASRKKETSSGSLWTDAVWPSRQVSSTFPLPGILRFLPPAGCCFRTFFNPGDLPRTGLASLDWLDRPSRSWSGSRKCRRTQDVIRDLVAVTQCLFRPRLDGSG